MNYKLIKIRPLSDFSSESHLRAVAGIKDLGIESFSLFKLPTLIAVLDPNGEINWDITNYLLDECFWSRSTQGDTVRTYAESIITWLNYLLNRNTLLSEATEVDLQAFRNELCIPQSPVRAERYASRTINLRVKTVTRYYQWAELHGVFSSPLGRWLNAGPNNHSLIGDFSFGFRHRNLVPKLEKRIPKVLTRAELSTLFKITPLPYSLMFKWAVVTGLRRFELCNLTLLDLPALQPLSVAEVNLEEIQILRKGGKEIPVLVPINLIEETKWYALSERVQPQTGNEKYVFINNAGRAISRQHLTRVFRSAANQIGSTATLHHLRHTFAVYTLHILQRRAKEGDSINPLKTLQILMGHASIESTEIYLRALDIQNEAVEDALAFLYGSTA